MDKNDQRRPAKPKKDKAVHPSMVRVYRAVGGPPHNIKSLSDLARALNWSIQRVNNWDARGISTEGAHEVQQILGVNATWIRTGKGDPSMHGTPEGWTELSLSMQGLAAGAGRMPDEYAETHRLMFRAQSLERKGLKKPNLRVEYVSGNSMEPRLRDGDVVLVDTADKRIKDGAIYWIRHNEEDFVKQVHRAGKAYVIESMNKAEPQWRSPIVVQPDDKFEIIGRVRWVGSWED